MLEVPGTDCARFDTPASSLLDSLSMTEYASAHGNVLNAAIAVEYSRLQGYVQLRMSRLTRGSRWSLRKRRPGARRRFRK